MLILVRHIIIVYAVYEEWIVPIGLKLSQLSLSGPYVTRILYLLHVYLVPIARVSCPYCT